MTSFGEIMKKAEESGSTFALLEAGEYTAKIIESDYQSSNGGKPQIKTRWEVTQGPKAGQKNLWNYFTLTVENPNAMSIFYRQMNALGITGEFLQSLAQLDPETAMKHIAQALNGRSAKIKVKVDTEWQNNKIERINPPPLELAGAVPQGAGSPFPSAQAPVASPLAPAAPAAAPAPIPQPAPVAAPQPPTEAPAPPSPVPAAPEGAPAPPF